MTDEVKSNEDTTLDECIVCKGKISSEADTCPHCGHMYFEYELKNIGLLGFSFICFLSLCQLQFKYAAAFFIIACILQFVSLAWVISDHKKKDDKSSLTFMYSGVFVLFGILISFAEFISYHIL